MKIPLLLLLSSLALSPAVLSAEGEAPAAGQQTPPPINVPGADVELPDLPVEPPRGRPERPEKPERPASPGQEKSDIVRGLVDDFRAKAEEYKNAQQDLVKRFKNASAEERARIREQIKEIKEQFREAKDQFQSEMKASHKVREELKRAIDLKNELPPNAEGPTRE